MKDRCPDISTEVDPHRKKGPQVEHDIEEELRLLHPKQGLEEDEVPGTADGQELCYSLNKSEENRFQYIHRSFFRI